MRRVIFGWSCLNPSTEKLPFLGMFSLVAWWDRFTTSFFAKFFLACEIMYHGAGGLEKGCCGYWLPQNFPLLFFIFHNEKVSCNAQEISGIFRNPLNKTLNWMGKPSETHWFRHRFFPIKPWESSYSSLGKVSACKARGLRKRPNTLLGYSHIFFRNMQWGW